MKLIAATKLVGIMQPDIAAAYKSYLALMAARPRVRKGVGMPKKFIPTISEQSSIDWINETYSTNFEKNRKGYRNEWMQGTPDILTEVRVLDIKAYAMYAKRYIREDCQLRAYMLLTGRKYATCIYIYKDSTGTVSLKRRDVIYCPEWEQELLRRFTLFNKLLNETKNV